MSRTVDDERRADLLERALDYVASTGLAELQLRPLATAVGASPRTLLYHFESKEALVVALLARAAERQRDLFATLPRDATSYAETVRGAWRIMGAPANVPIFRLFFETYGLALANPQRFPGFLERAVEGWLGFLGAPAIRDGYTKRDARAIATVLLAGYRGFLLDLCATGDRRRIARAVEIWIASLDAIPAPGAISQREVSAAPRPSPRGPRLR